MNAQLSRKVVVMLGLLCLFGVSLLASMKPRSGLDEPTSEVIAPDPIADSREAAHNGCPHCKKHLATAQASLEEPEAKIDAAYAGSLSCDPPERSKSGVDMASFFETQIAPFSCRSGEESAHKRIAVSQLVEKALDDQVGLLQAKRAELQRWDGRTQVFFAKWFGTMDERARDLILARIGILSQLNDRYSVSNFRRAFPPKPGLFAYVHPQDPTKVFVDMAFVKAPPVGENSRAGTITHEMSHFTISGGTKDFTYGPANCKALARTAPQKALFNADNFEYFVEGVQ